MALGEVVDQPFWTSVQRLGESESTVLVVDCAMKAQVMVGGKLYRIEDQARSSCIDLV